MQWLRWLTLVGMLALICVGRVGCAVPARAQAPVETQQAVQPLPLAAAQDPEHYDFQVPPQAVAYQRAMRTVGLVGLGWKIIGIGLFLWGGFSVRTRNWLQARLRLPMQDPARAPALSLFALQFAAYALWMSVWLLPIQLGYLWFERQYGFSRQTPATFLGDMGLQWLFSLLWVIPLWGMLWLRARTGKHWWKWAWAGLLPLLLGAVVLHPLVFTPAFNHFTPLENGPMRDRILSLADRAGIRNATVLVEDTDRRTEHVNAYVTGLGPSTRIVLNNTALRKLPEAELLAMMAHEMGHYVEGHLRAAIVGGMVGGGFFLWFMARLWIPFAERWGARWGLRGVNDVATIPLLMLTISLFLLVQSPVESAISRHLEARADAFGLRLTRDREGMARLFIGFAQRDFSDPDPPALLHGWFGNHPTLRERLIAAFRTPFDELR